MGAHRNRLMEAVLMGARGLCFEAEIKKNVYPCTPQFHYIKVGCKGVFITRTCLRDEKPKLILKMCTSRDESGKNPN